jgi:mutator protein MutT
METIVVTAAVIEHERRFLVTRRQEGGHLAGYWEFPGGKCHSRESYADCLARELREELGVEAMVGAELLVTAHTYPDRRVELHFLKCELKGRPVPQIGQQMRWVTRQELAELRLPPADAELIDLLTSEREVGHNRGDAID